MASTRIFGLGERLSSELLLCSGNYTLFPYNGDNTVENGTGNKQGYGMHPFLMMQTAKGRFMGMFLFNSNPMECEVQVYNQSSLLTFRVGGGILDFSFFTGPTYQDVVRQYAQVIGKPKMVPLWIQGFFSKTTAYKDGDVAVAAITKYKEGKYPLQGVSLPLAALSAYHNLVDTQPIVDKIRAAHPDQYLVLPFTHVVPNDTDKTELDKFLNNSDGISFAMQAKGNIEVFL